MEEHVDVLVHGGDVFHRPSVPSSLVHQAFQPLKEVADAGIPVCLVPGNHERSRIPFDWLAHHPRVHVFKEPSTVRLSVAGSMVSISGIPCIRRGARSRFPAVLSETAWEEQEAGLRLLLTHQAFEGAVVGPVNFTFRHGDDVVRLRDVPDGFAAVLSGHIHRWQVLEKDLQGESCPAPVFYPGSVERTAFAERGEEKGFLVVELTPTSGGGAVCGWEFRHLEARSMEVRPLRVQGLSAAALQRELGRVLDTVPADAVLRLEADGAPAPDSERVLAAETLRALAPPTMNVEVVIPGQRRWSGRRRSSPRSGSGGPRSQPPSESDGSAQTDLF